MEERIKMEVKLRDAMETWLKTCKMNSVKPATYDRLIVSFRFLKRDYISNMDLQSLTKLDLQRYLNRIGDQNYSVSTIKKQLNLLTAFLKYAYSEGLIERALHIGLTIPKFSANVKQAKKLEVYSQFEEQCLMRELKTLSHISYAAGILMLQAGLRVGEALSLTWDDILWDRRAIRIDKTLVRLSSQHGITFVQNGAKSRTSNRTIPLSNAAYDILKALYEASKPSSKYIFPDDDEGIPMSYFTVVYHLKRACEKSNVPYKGCHSFRHTFATNCYNRGCNVKILSKLLGHADVSITYNIYIHLYGDALDEMRSVLG